MEHLAASGGQDFDLTLSVSVLFQGNQGGLSVRANLRIRWVQASSGRLACGDRGGIHDVIDPKFAYRHSAPSNIDGTTGLVTDEQERGELNTASRHETPHPPPHPRSFG